MFKKQQKKIQTSFVLTVSESKRLIAKAVAILPEVLNARSNGILVVSTGSTNAYVAEEILDRSIEKRGFLTGHYKPSGLNPKSINLPDKIPDLILKNSNEIKDKGKFEIIHEMKSEDVFIKGANALNYKTQTAGIAIGDSKGGTIGGIIGAVTAKNIKLVIPIGLEKLVAHDITKSWRKLNSGGSHPAIHGLFPVYGKIITEIEAFAILFGLDAIHVGSGGIFGAEGGICLVVEGEKDVVEKAEKRINEIHGESAF